MARPKKYSGIYRCASYPKMYKYDIHLEKEPGMVVHLHSGYIYETAKKASEALSSRIDLEKSRGKISDSSVFSWLLEKYCGHLKDDMKATSFWQTKMMLQRCLCSGKEGWPDFSALPIKEVFTQERMEGFRSFLAAYKSPKSGRLFSRDYKNRILFHLKQIAEFAFDRGMISQEELRNARVFLPDFKSDAEIPLRKRTALTPEQYAAFIDTFTHDDKWRYLFEFLFDTGCRIGEALALEIGDYDPESAEVTINKTAAFKTEPGEGTPKTQSPKTKAGNRVVKLFPSMASEMGRYLPALKGKPKSNRLFFGQESIICPTSVRKCFDKHLKAAHLPHFTVHEIRHTATTWEVNACPTAAGAQAVSARLGRASVAVTLDLYYHGDEKTMDKITEKMAI